MAKVEMTLLQSERDVLRDQIRQQIRQALRREGLDGRASNVAQAQSQGGTPAIATPQPPAAPGVLRAPQATIDAINAQIVEQKALIQQLTGKLVPGMSDDATNAITDQIQAAQERLTTLQSQYDRAIGAARPETRFDANGGGLPPELRDIPQRVENMVYSTFLLIAMLALGIPLIRVFGRRVDRKTQAAIAAATANNANLEPRLERIEQAVEAIAIEVERVSEGQRFTNKLMSEMRALPAPNPLEQRPKAGEKVGEKEAARRGE